MGAVAGTAAPSQPRGLTIAEAADALTRVGPNVLPQTEQVPAWRRLSRQFVHFFALLLWVAAGLAVVGGMPALGAAIVAVVLVNGVFAFVQEKGLQREILYEMLPVAYAHPKMDPDSVLISIGFTPRKREEVLAPIPFLGEKFARIRTSQDEGAGTRWIMKELRKLARLARK